VVIGRSRWRSRSGPAVATNPLEPMAIRAGGRASKARQDLVTPWLQKAAPTAGVRKLLHIAQSPAAADVPTQVPAPPVACSPRTTSMNTAGSEVGPACGRSYVVLRERARIRNDIYNTTCEWSREESTPPLSIVCAIATRALHEHHERHWTRCSGRRLCKRLH